MGASDAKIIENANPLGHCALSPCACAAKLLCAYETKCFIIRNCYVCTKLYVLLHEIVLRAQNHMFSCSTRRVKWYDAFITSTRFPFFALTGFGFCYITTLKTTHFHIMKGPIGEVKKALGSTGVKRNAHVSQMDQQASSERSL